MCLAAISNMSTSCCSLFRHLLNPVRISHIIRPISLNWNLSVAALAVELDFVDELVLYNDDPLMTLAWWVWATSGAALAFLVDFGITGKFFRFFRGAGVGLVSFLLFVAEILVLISMNSLSLEIRYFNTNISVIYSKEIHYTVLLYRWYPLIPWNLNF